MNKGSGAENPVGQDKLKIRFFYVCQSIRLKEDLGVEVLAEIEISFEHHHELVSGGASVEEDSGHVKLNRHVFGEQEVFPDLEHIEVPAEIAASGISERGEIIFLHVEADH